LQPVERFIASPKLKNPDNRAAFATAEQRKARQEGATGSLLPGLSGKGSYTRNRYDAALGIPGAAPSTVQSKATLDAYFTLSGRTINVRLWVQRRAATSALASARVERQSTAASVEANVVLVPRPCRCVALALGTENGDVHPYYLAGW
jgi:outer membrane protein TolC